MLLPSHAPHPPLLPGRASASACPAADPVAPDIPSGGFTFSKSRELAPPPLLAPPLVVALLPLLAPLPLLPAAAGSAAAAVAVVGVCFGLKGAPTGEPAPALVDAPSLRDCNR